MKKTKSKKKIFILDTNVILHDNQCIYKFENNDVVIPITVIEELDNFKTGNRTINFQAREFVRTLDTLSNNIMLDKGIKIGKGLGNISIHLEKDFHPDLLSAFNPNKPDHKILNIAYCLAEKHPSKNIILVSKDANLRMKARSVKINAQDFTSDHVKDITTLYKGYKYEENIDATVIDQMYNVPFEIEFEKTKIESPVIPNQFFILRSANKSALATYNKQNDTICHVEKRPAYGIVPRNAEQTFALDALLNPDIRLVTLSGKAGTGKTLLALAAALECRKSYNQIFLARPVIPLSNKDIGFLPGDIKSKLDPYMQPIFDNLGVIKNQYDANDKKHMLVNEMLDKEKLMIAPLSYIRGRSLVKVFFIVDEAQNLTPHEVKTIITRAGENTKMIFTGDIFQIDHPYLDILSNGLCYLIEKMQNQNIYAHVNLEKGERSELADLASDLL